MGLSTANIMTGIADHESGSDGYSLALWVGHINAVVAHR